MEQKRTIKWNVELWKWYFNTNDSIVLDKEKEQAFNIMGLASSEDIRLFTRFLLYTANTRNFKKDIKYKTLCYFTGLMFPDFAIANLDLILRLGKKSDILYFMPAIPEKIMTYVNHKAKEDNDFILLQNEQINGFVINRVVRYKPINSKHYKWQYFFEKLASDINFNGILAGQDFDIMQEYVQEIEQ